MAQSGSVHGWGPCGRRFKSCHPDNGMPSVFLTLGIFDYLGQQLLVINRLPLKVARREKKSVYLDK